MKTEAFGLNNNQLKILAMLSMLADHVGMALFPEIELLRILGRISFPIFAYMIAEGCLHTRNRLRYLGTMAVFAAVCQVVYTVATGSLYQNILVTFCLAAVTIFALDYFLKKKNLLSALAALITVVSVVLVCVVLPKLPFMKDFYVSYGLAGVLFPVAVYFAPTKPLKLLASAVMMVLLSISALQLGILQWFCFLALPLLLLYNGKRGEAKLKYLFYIFYPVHLGVIYLIQFLMHQ